MIIAALSDLHGYVPSPAAQAIVDKADVVCHAPVRLASTTCRNVSYLDEHYTPAFLPILFKP